MNGTNGPVNWTTGQDGILEIMDILVQILGFGVEGPLDVLEEASLVCGLRSGISSVETAQKVRGISCGQCGQTGSGSLAEFTIFRNVFLIKAFELVELFHYNTLCRIYI